MTEQDVHICSDIIHDGHMYIVTALFGEDVVMLLKNNTNFKYLVGGGIKFNRTGFYLHMMLLIAMTLSLFNDRFDICKRDVSKYEEIASEMLDRTNVIERQLLEYQNNQSLLLELSPTYKNRDITFSKQFMGALSYAFSQGIYAYGQVKTFGVKNDETIELSSSQVAMYTSPSREVDRVFETVETLDLTDEEQNEINGALSEMIFKHQLKMNELKQTSKKYNQSDLCKWFHKSTKQSSWQKTKKAVVIDVLQYSSTIGELYYEIYEKIYEGLKNHKQAETITGKIMTPFISMSWPANMLVLLLFGLNTFMSISIKRHGVMFYPKPDVVKFASFQLLKGGGKYKICKKCKKYKKPK